MKPSRPFLGLSLASLTLSGLISGCAAVNDFVSTAQSALNLTRPTEEAKLNQPKQLAQSSGGSLGTLNLGNVINANFQLPDMQGLLGGMPWMTWAWPDYRPEGPVVINGRTLTEEDQARLLLPLGGFGPLGDWWYDDRSGAFGPVGGPFVTILPVGLQLGPMPEDCSRGTSPYWVNGRRLTEVEGDMLEYSQGVGGGRYWIDQEGMMGREGSGEKWSISERAEQHQGGKEMTREERDALAQKLLLAYLDAVQVQNTPTPTKSIERR